MSLTDTATQIAADATLVSTALTQLKSLISAIATLRSTPRSTPAPVTEYETLRLEIVLDLQDAQGHRAVLGRRQSVRFLVPDTGVVRDLVWGDGNQVAHYTAKGARRVLDRAEGSRHALLLGMDHRPMQGERITIASRRLIERGFLDSSEYCEVVVERPTEYLALTVLFPQNRPPHNAQLVCSQSTGPTRKLGVRHRSSGRPFLKWSCRAPTQECVYSLRWSW
jgi:hypothetical protein